MSTVVGTLGALLALAGATLLAETTPTVRSNATAPISAELAKTCRELAIKGAPLRSAKVAVLALDRHSETISRVRLPTRHYVKPEFTLRGARC